MLFLLFLAAPAAAQEVATEPVDVGVFGEPVRFEAAPGTVLTLGSGRRLVGTVEVRPNPRSDGLVVIGDMDTDTYVEGIAEMPARWPLEALKAQAIAARTYAWYQITLGTFQDRGLGYDICATTACQVFRGRDVVEAPEVGQRWAEAVAATSGQVLLFDGAPILARYFSTSGGETRNNEDIFRSEGPFPYLVGFADPFDEVSPLHTWQATFTRAQFDDLIARGESLGPTSPVASVVVSKRDDGPDRVTVTGIDGTSATVTAGQFKDFLNGVAPSVYPDDFPGERSDGGTLPTTLPSSRFVVDVREDEVVVDGSGWGHQVGMGQYGALGRAEAGHTTEEILAAYYNGLQPTTSDALPARIRVGLDDDADALDLRADGPMRVVVGDTVIAEQAVGDWRLTDDGQDTVGVVAPPGVGQPLVVSPTSVSRRVAFDVEEVVVDAVVNKTARTRVVVRSAEEVVAEQDVGIVAGRQRTRLQVDELGLEPGDYDVTVEATDETGATAGTSTGLRIVPLPSSPPPSLVSALASPSEPVTEGPRPVPVATAGLLGLAAGLLRPRRDRTEADR